MSTESDLLAVRDAGLLSVEQHDRIVNFLKNRQGEERPRFDLTHLLWYAGALLIMAAMGLFTNEAFNKMGGMALTVTGIIYAAALAALGHHFWYSRKLQTPGGLLIAAAVSMVPLIIYGVQDYLDLWRFAQGDPGQYHDFFPYMHGSWLYMEIGTVAAAALALRFYRAPFILLVAGIALWFMSMDLALWFNKVPYALDWDVRRTTSMIFGIVVIMIAWAMDIRRRSGPDLAFWLHVFGIMTFWGGLSASDGSTELQRFIYFLINVGLLGLSLFLNRKVYAVFGTLGIALYLGYLAFDLFEDMIVFSFALSLIGLAVIFLGLKLHKNYSVVTAAVDAAIPAWLRWLRPDIR